MDSEETRGTACSTDMDMFEGGVCDAWGEDSGLFDFEFKFKLKFGVNSEACSVR